MIEYEPRGRSIDTVSPNHCYINIETAGGGALRPIIPFSGSMKKVKGVLLPRFGDPPGKRPGITDLESGELRHFDEIQAPHEIHQDPLLRQDLFLGAGPFGRWV